MIAQSSTVYRYRVDESDVIVAVDQWWLAFAQENGAAGMDAPSVVGQSIWRSIADEATRTLYKELHGYVRSAGIPVTVPFRCDSPTLERHMQLTINREPSGCLLYESELIRVRPRRRIRILDPTEKRSKSFLTMCSCCKRSLLEPSGWLDPKDISVQLRLFEGQAIPELRYTTCPECARHFESVRVAN